MIGCMMAPIPVIRALHRRTSSSIVQVIFHYTTVYFKYSMDQIKHESRKHTANSTLIALVALVALVSIVGVAWLDVVLSDFITVCVDTCVTDDFDLHTVSSPNIGPLQTLYRDLRPQQISPPHPINMFKRCNVLCCYGMWYRCLDKAPGLRTWCLDNDHDVALDTQPQLHASEMAHNST